MTIRVRRSGSIGGFRREWSVDTARLAPPEAEELTRLAEEVDFDALRCAPHASGGDRSSYHLEIVGTRAQTVEVSESALQGAARARRPDGGAERCADESR